MTPFEQELRTALAHQQPSDGFTERLLAQLPPPKRAASSWRLPIAAMAALLLAGGAAYQQYERQIQGQAAKRQLLVAMHIAGSKLHQVQQRVQQSEVNQ